MGRGCLVGTWAHTAGMRYRDARHVDLGGFLAGNAEGGSWYRLLGYAGLVLAWYHQAEAGTEAILLTILLGCWVLAWYRAVGALYRTSVVAALLLCALALTRLALDPAAVGSLR
jgi:hypothetical protein